MGPKERRGLLYLPHIVTSKKKKWDCLSRFMMNYLKFLYMDRLNNDHLKTNKTNFYKKLFCLKTAAQAEYIRQRERYSNTNCNVSIPQKLFKLQRKKNFTPHPSMP
ncbi:hypothetical protein GDO78_008498 [Eleutherodactylus coqui]|uniref:Uncharacterized protein n=1 Tax=Eleutherodactylus coqui TaxID=57060 RepID=A0A8J6KA55_ELECQ|nr:hypothetical protein GDO78_008498 [Eleutherodactylus coqui]